MAVKRPGRPADILDQLPHWNTLTAIPVMETPYMHWSDTPIVLTLPGTFSPKPVTHILVGDQRHFRNRLEARNEVRDIIRTGMRDVLDWLEAAGRKVYV